MSILDDFIMHIGVGWDHNPPGVGSSRFPHGSGDLPYQHAVDFLSKDLFYRAKYPGESDTFYAEKLGCLRRVYGKNVPSSDLYRDLRRDAESRKKMHDWAQVQKLKAEGKGATEIARELGFSNESTVRNYMKEFPPAKASEAARARDLLREFTNTYTYADISKSSENGFGIGRGALDAATESLIKFEGYNKYQVTIPQAGTNYKTTYNVLVPPGVSYSELWDNRFSIVNPVTADKLVNLETGDVTSLGLLGKPVSLSSDRIAVAYNSPKDGMIELRPGVPDISLGNKYYAQVRIGVDDTHYLKGMAVYSDDLPDGVDVRFNTSKKEGTPLMVDLNPNTKQVLKPMKTIKDENGKIVGIDWDNPFGASINPNADVTITAGKYTDMDGDVKRSTINVVREQGEWMDWSANLPAQYLSKMPLETAKQQLGVRLADKKLEFERIKQFTNPTVKKFFLDKFADECDGNAVDLKAAPFKDQQTHVILACPELGDNECYCPRYKDGTKVVLVRFPFANFAESPMLTVRNTGSPAEKLFPKTVTDAIALNGRTQAQMSGADNDGDTCLVIPLSDKVKVRWSDTILPGLENFDHKSEFSGYDGLKPKTHKQYQTMMGSVTNLVTDMSFQDPPLDDLVRAIKMTMVVIDAEKNNLDVDRAWDELGIQALKIKYQADEKGRTGAGTIISRAKSKQSVDERDDWTIGPDRIDENGDKIYSYTEKSYKDVKLDLSNVKLNNGTTVNLKHDDKTGFYYKEGKNKIYVSDENLPDYLKKYRISGAGWVRMDTDNKTHKDYISVYNKDTRKWTRIYKENLQLDVLEEKVRMRQQDSTKMAEHKDAYDLVSKAHHPMEIVYADFANEMKELARAARREWLRTGDQVKDPKAAELYKAEVDSLNRQLAKADANAPFERSAQLLASRTMQIKLYENPEMTSEEKTKKRGQAIAAARNILGAGKERIDVSEKEYEAIQAGAISKTALTNILNNCNLDVLRERATPKNKKTLSAAEKASILVLARSGVGAAALSDRLQVSVKTIYKYLEEANIDVSKLESESSLSSAT